ncbi:MULTISPECIES: HAD family hydrolase [Methanothrix]|jgi:putative hydrolase of the HAD superfamily|uniref:HAD family hydrolase n=1 Tax=Methanothrix soehngenii TaxID=2223 RepID=A0A7K4AHR3_METSH|nr:MULTISPECIES: HAD family hydrolase [Methanothrix]NYT10561.1 HAD family hydrolase [Methanosarcinales archaeon]MDD3551170.1 HAD family hydrolase [Methanothrix soehngenii]MDY0411330.1 HAD family hydrolase [Methanothrix soehngenii]NLJ22465.1 HAD family hydrolase [Methanothrix soehngenii]UEC39728.1 MAG: HAD-superfamily hydrolase, subfamily IA, variant 1 [Methanothrix sp.]
MIRIISLDMDGTLVNSRFVDKVWMEGMPRLYAERTGLDLPAAREYVIGEYMKIGSDHLEWYDLKFWIDKFGLSIGKEELLELYEDEIEVYPEVEEVLELLSENYELVVTSNAAREFIDIELDGLQGYFREVFSATSDFREVKKSPLLYGAICAHLDARPFEVLHIGDHYSYDYESALDAGLDALFLDRRGERQGPEVIGDLREAVELIGGCA